MNAELPIGGYLADEKLLDERNARTRGTQAAEPVRIILPRGRGIGPEAAQVLYEAIMDAAAKQKAEWEKRHCEADSTSPTPRAEEER